MNWEFLPMAIIMLVVVLAPPVLLVIARRKQKRPGGFVSIDPGLGRWNAFPLQLGEDLTADPAVTTAEPDGDPEERRREVIDDPVERIRQRRRREGRGR